MMQLRKKYLVVIFFTLIFFVAFFFSLKYINNLPKKVIEYQGISLGNSKDEVFYALGVPDDVLFPPEKIIDFDAMSQRYASKDEIKKSPKREKDFHSWQYNKQGFRVDVDFDPLTGKVNSIGCYISSIRDYADTNTCKVNGIRALDTEERVIDVLGKPYRFSINGTTKEMVYPDLNMRVILETKYTYYIIVTNLLTK